MKRITLFLFISSFFSLNAQDCPSGDVIIADQAEMNAFEAQYPNCTQINGDLEIGTDDNPNYFNSIFPDLPALESITGNLRFYASSTANGFPQLQYVGGNLWVTYSNLGGTFMALDTVMGSISQSGDGYSYGSPNDVSFPTCPQLKYIGGGLSLYAPYGGGLLEGDDFPALEYIGGSLSEYSAFPSFNLSGFVNLRYVGGNLDIQTSGISYFNTLDTIGGSLIMRGPTFSYSTLDVNITGLNQLKYLGSDFIMNSFQNEYCLQDLSGLSQLDYIGGDFEYVQASGCQNALTSLNGLQALKQVGGSILIDRSDLLDLDFLEQLESVGGNLEIVHNNDLENLEGLNHTVDINGEVIITDNTVLSECVVQAVCDHLEADYLATIANNAAGCNNVQEVETGCDALPIEMTDPLRVHLKDETAILEWRTAIEVDNAGFEIQRSKDGIEWEKIGWQAGQGNMSVPHSYTYTDRNPLFGTSYYRLKQVDFNGDTEYSNAVSLQYIREGVIVYPNPVKEQLYLYTGYSFVQKITIYNSAGSQVTEITNPANNVDVSILPKGIYVLKITIDKKDFYERILVE